MALLARIIKHTETWSLYDADRYWGERDFPFLLLNELGPVPNVSFYEVDTEDDAKLLRIAAAWILSRKNLESRNTVREFGFRFVRSGFITSTLGLKIAKTEGQTADILVNRLHREVDFSGRNAVRLLRELRKHRKMFTMKEVGKSVIESIEKKWAQGAVYKKELVWTLYDAGLEVKKLN